MLPIMVFVRKHLFVQNSIHSKTNAFTPTSDTIMFSNNSPTIDKEDKVEDVDYGAVFAYHLLHDKEYETPPAPPTSDKKHHIKDNFTPPFNPPAWEFDMAIDPPDVTASMETFAHHLLHDEEYEPTTPIYRRKEHLKDNYVPPEAPPTKPTSSYMRRAHLKDNYVPPETPHPPADMEEKIKKDPKHAQNHNQSSLLGSPLSYAAHSEYIAGEPFVIDMAKKMKEQVAPHSSSSSLGSFSSAEHFEHRPGQPRHLVTFNPIEDIINRGER